VATQRNGRGEGEKPKGLGADKSFHRRESLTGFEKCPSRLQGQGYLGRITHNPCAKTSEQKVRGGRDYQYEKGA